MTMMINSRMKFTKRIRLYNETKTCIICGYTGPYWEDREGCPYCGHSEFGGY